MHRSVLLDTSFFLRFLHDQDPLFKNADGYFRYFLRNNMPMMISTISIAEYCVRGHIDELPLRNLQIVPFNLDHATKTGEFARIVFRNRNTIRVTERNIIPNDTKLFAQASVEKAVRYYLSSDEESLKIYNLLGQHTLTGFQFLNLKVPFGEAFGELELG